MTQEQSISENMRRIATAVRDLADGLSRSDRNKREADTDIHKALTEILSTLEVLKRDALSAETLADVCSRETLDRARALHWQRMKGEPELLPLPPHELVPSRDRGDEKTGVTDIVHKRSGQAIEKKSLLQLVVATVVSAIVGALAHHFGLGK